MRGEDLVIFADAGLGLVGAAAGSNGDELPKPCLAPRHVIRCGERRAQYQREAYARAQHTAGGEGTQHGASHTELPGTVTLPYPVAERGLIGGQDAGFLGVRHDPLVVRPQAGVPYPGVSPVSDAPDFAAIGIPTNCPFAPTPPWRPTTPR